MYKVEIDGVSTNYTGADAFRNAVRDTVRAVKGADNASPSHVRLIDVVDANAEVELANIPKGARTSCS